MQFYQVATVANPEKPTLNNLCLEQNYIRQKRAQKGSLCPVYLNSKAKTKKQVRQEVREQAKRQNRHSAWGAPTLSKGAASPPPAPRFRLHLCCWALNTQYSIWAQTDMEYSKIFGHPDTFPGLASIRRLGAVPEHQGSE